jgi:hypothetical protein
MTATAAIPLSAEESARLRGAPLNLTGPVRITRGVGRDPAWEKLVPDRTGVYRVEISQTGRIEIDLGADGERAQIPTKRMPFSGYLVVGEELRPLPIGSTLDGRTGRFSWMPGPGFLGTYDLLLLRTDDSGVTTKVPVKVTITPVRGNGIEMKKESERSFGRTA